MKKHVLVEVIHMNLRDLAHIVVMNESMRLQKNWIKPSFLWGCWLALEEARVDLSDLLVDPSIVVY